MLSWLFIHISRIDYDSTWSMTVKYVKRKKNGYEGDKKEEGTSSGLSVGDWVLPYMGYTPCISD